MDATIPDAFTPVVPGGGPRPRLRPRTRLGPEAHAAAPPRINPGPGAPASVGSGAGSGSGSDSGSDSGYAGGKPLAVHDLGYTDGGDNGAPTDTDSGSDLSADIPRVKPRTGFARKAFDATSGMASVRPGSDPVSAFAQAFSGAQNADQKQDYDQRKQSIENVQVKSLEEQRQATAEERAANADYRRSLTSAGPPKKDLAEYYRLRLEAKKNIWQAHGLGVGSTLLESDKPAAEQAAQAEFATFAKQLDTSWGIGDDAGGQGIDSQHAGALTPPADSAVTQTFSGDGAAAPAGPASAITAPPDAAPPVATPAPPKPTPTGDNISGTGSLTEPYRVKDWKAPGVRDRIRVGDHFVVIGEDGKEHIHIRDR